MSEAFEYELSSDPKVIDVIKGYKSTLISTHRELPQNPEEQQDYLKTSYLPIARELGNVRAMNLSAELTPLWEFVTSVKSSNDISDIPTPLSLREKYALARVTAASYLIQGVEELPDSPMYTFPARFPLEKEGKLQQVTFPEYFLLENKLPRQIREDTKLYSYMRDRLQVIKDHLDTYSPPKAFTGAIAFSGEELLFGHNLTSRRIDSSFEADLQENWRNGINSLNLYFQAKD